VYSEYHEGKELDQTKQNQSCEETDSAELAVDSLDLIVYALSLIIVFHFELILRKC